MVTSLRVVGRFHDPLFQSRFNAILSRHIRERCGFDVPITETGDYEIVLEVQSDFSPDAFSITKRDPSTTIISGQNQRALLYGLGKFLRTSNFHPYEFIPSTWIGVSTPECRVRGIYCATHFYNFYHAAPIEVIEHYLEDLTLWGINTVIVWYDMHHFTAITDPAAQMFLNRLRSILQTAKALNLQVGLTLLANEAYKESPRELRADQRFPKTKHIRGGFGVELCPSKPAAKKLLLQWITEELIAFKDIGLDFLMIWPYDQGGCCCDQCRPWGANGFLIMAEAIARIGRHLFPHIQNILSTWLFDPGINEGEWEGLTAKLGKNHEWVDFILADSHTTYPRYPLTHGVPGGLPLLNFPEISMWGMSPWGGYGANPLPYRFQEFGTDVRPRIQGGFPYSEGIYEDVNKILWIQWYWERNRPVEAILHEYVTYEFPGCEADAIVQAIVMLEQNHKEFTVKQTHHWPWSPPHPNIKAIEIVQIFTHNSTVLPPHIVQSWRWRILYFRAILDYERYNQSFYPTPITKKILKELTELYYAHKADPWIKPPINGN